MDWLPSALLLVVLPVLSGWAGAFLTLWYFHRALREAQYDLAVLEDRLLREIKRRAGEARWSEPGKAPADVEEAVKELRQLAIGEVDGKGFRQGKEGGVYHGTV